MTRALPEWVATHDDQTIPPRVRLRIFDRANGFCVLCTRRIGGSVRAQYDHIVALVNGGRHAEGNLQLVCHTCHKAKTAEDVAEKSKTYVRKAKHVGVRKKKRTIPGRRFNGEPIPARWREA